MCSVCRFCYLISIIFRSDLIAILNARLAFNMSLRLCQIQYGYWSSLAIFKTSLQVLEDYLIYPHIMPLVTSGNQMYFLLLLQVKEESMLRHPKWSSRENKRFNDINWTRAARKCAGKKLVPSSKITGNMERERLEWPNSTMPSGSFPTTLSPAVPFENWKWERLTLWSIKSTRY